MNIAAGAQIDGDSVQRVGELAGRRELEHLCGVKLAQAHGGTRREAHCRTHTLAHTPPWAQTDAYVDQ